MARHLLLAHAVADSPGLVAAARQLAAGDPSAELVAIVPSSASPLELLCEPRLSPARIAARRARRLWAELHAAGLTLAAIRMGNQDPERAVEDALRFSAYESIVVASPPHKMLHAVHRDLACRLAQRFPNVRVIHAGRIARAEVSPTEMTSSRTESAEVGD